jgi:type II secretory pathway component PulF
MIFVYKALTKDNKPSQGTVEAQSRAEAMGQLEARGLAPLSLKVRDQNAAGGGWSLPILFQRQGVTSLERDEFTRQLSILLSAGVPLAEALKILVDEAPSEQAKAQWQKLHNDVVGGTSLAESMAHYPEVFARVYVAMVRAGETGGFLDVVLQQIAEFQEKEKELRSRLIGALTYPLVLIGLSIAVLIFLLTFFIPRFQGIFADFGANLPVLTRAIVATGMAVKHYGLFAAVLIGLGIWRLVLWLKTEQGRRRQEHWMLRTPILRQLISQFALTRFSRMLGTLTSSGVPLLTALRVAKESVGIQTLIDTLESAAEQMQNGSRLAEALSECPELFPRSVLQIVAVAEQSGSLDKELIRLGERTERELDRRMKTATALIEPALLFVMAAFVGTIVIGMVLPIFSLQDYIK